MSEGTSLSDILNDEPSLPEVEDTQPAPVVEDTQPRDDTGRFAAKETGVEPHNAEPVPPTNQLPKEDYKAIRDEREKRQALERELEALKQQFAAPQEQAPPPSIWEDDQGALQHVKQEAIGAAVQQATFNAKLDMSEMMVRQANPDFEDVKAEFLALAQQNPVLVQQALSDPHPWSKAYQIAKNHKAMQELGATNVDDLRAKIRAELEAEMQVQQPVRQSIPPSLATERNVGSRSGPAWSGPRPLSELLG